MKGLILVYLLTLVGVVGSLRKPLIGLFVYVGFAVLRPQFIWSFAGDISNVSFIVGTAMLVGWALHGFGRWQFARATPVVVALLAFQAWVTVSAVQAIEPTVAFEWVVALMKVVAPFVVGITMLESARQSRAMMWTIVLAQAYVCVEMNMSYYLEGYNRAAEAGFGGMDNNSFGISLVATIGPAIALALSERRWRWRALAAVATVLILHTTLLTFSRGAFVGLIGVGLSALVVMPKRPTYVGALLLVALLGVRLTGPQLAERFSTTFTDADDRDGAAASRIELWIDCFDAALKRPLFGLGPRNWPVVAGSYGWTDGKEAHSTWMQTLAETGFPGAIALVSFFGLAAIKLLPIARARINDENRSEVATATGVIMTIAGFAIAGQFVTLTGLEIPYYMTMIGVVLIKNRKAVQPQPALAAARPTTAGSMFPAPALRGPVRGVAVPPPRPVQRT